VPVELQAIAWAVPAVVPPTICKSVRERFAVEDTVKHGVVAALMSTFIDLLVDRLNPPPAAADAAAMAAVVIVARAVATPVPDPTPVA
jgi:hypothetical protein